MILQDLYMLYELKQESEPEAIPPRYWCVRKAFFEICIEKDGSVLSFIPLLDSDGKPGRDLYVPMAYTSRSGQKPVPGFLCDDAQHVFGIGPSPNRAELRQMHVDLCEKVLGACSDAGALAYLSFLEETRAGDVPTICTELNDDPKTNVVFRLVGDAVFIHEREQVRLAWETYAKGREERSESTFCLVKGELAPVSHLFPQVTGLPGAQGAGASLISSNIKSFISYGQEATSSISEEASVKAGAALIYVLKDQNHRVRIGNDYVVFWTEAKEPQADDLVSFLLDFGDAKAQKLFGVSEDAEVRAAVQAAFDALRKGKEIIPISGGTPYHVLGIAPYQARLAVRFYETGTLGELQERVAQFLRDTEMVNSSPRSLRSYLAQTAVQGEAKNIPSPLITACMRALLRGTPFPEALEEQILLRTRVDNGAKNPWDMGQRAAILKAILIRKARTSGKKQDVQKERSLTVSLNKANTNEGYLLGRLFALLEKVQQDAIGGANATIRDRYMGAAATTPARVYPQLLNLAQHHISKSEYGELVNRQIQEVIGMMDDAGFPKTLSYDDQGMFYIGYYQQKQALYTKKAAEPAEDDTTTTEEE